MPDDQKKLLDLSAVTFDNLNHQRRLESHQIWRQSQFGNTASGCGGAFMWLAGRIGGKHLFGYRQFPVKKNKTKKKQFCESVHVTKSQRFCTQMLWTSSLWMKIEQFVPKCHNIHDFDENWKIFLDIKRRNSCVCIFNLFVHLYKMRNILMCIWKIFFLESH